MDDVEKKTCRKSMNRKAFDLKKIRTFPARPQGGGKRLENILHLFILVDSYKQACQHYVHVVCYKSAQDTVETQPPRGVLQKCTGHCRDATYLVDVIFSYFAMRFGMPFDLYTQSVYV